MGVISRWADARAPCYRPSVREVEWSGKSGRMLRMSGSPPMTIREGQTASPLGQGGGPVPVIDDTSLVWVVLDRAGEVVLMCSGGRAAEVAQEWAERGYETVLLDADEVYAA